MQERVAADSSGMKASISALKVSLAGEIASAKIWALVLYIALAAGIFGTMARGFGWL